MALDVSSTVKSYLRSILGETLIGSIDYLRYPARRVSWGGPFNGQKGRQALFQAIVACTEPVAILETGTYLGTSTEFMSETSLPIYSIEGLPRNYGFARVNLWRKRNVRLYLGDSRHILRTLLAGKLKTLQNRTVFAYLDAHWNDDLPLREELEIIYDHFPATVVMIDDFEVPDDPGYQFDDYGPGKRLSAAYIEPVVLQYNLGAYYPSLPSSEETGTKRGCVVLGSERIHGSLLDGLPMLKQIGDESEAAQRGVTSK